MRPSRVTGRAATACEWPPPPLRLARASPSVPRLTRLSRGDRGSPSPAVRCKRELPWLPDSARPARGLGQLFPRPRAPASRSSPSPPHLQTPCGGPNLSPRPPQAIEPPHHPSGAAAPAPSPPWALSPSRRPRPRLQDPGLGSLTGLRPVKRRPARSSACPPFPPRQQRPGPERLGGRLAASVAAASHELYTQGRRGAGASAQDEPPGSHPRAWTCFRGEF